MTLATLKLAPCGLNEGTGCPVNMDMLMEKKNFPQYDRAVQDGVYHEGQGQCQPCISYSHQEIQNRISGLSELRL